MKHAAFALLCLSFVLPVAMVTAEEASSKAYELRTYTTNEGKLPNLNARFKDHTTDLFEKHGMENIVYWTPTAEDKKDNTLVYIIAHDSREAAKANWKGFGGDPAWKKVAKESQLDGKILSTGPERVYISETDFSPHALKNGKETRLFELRTYTTDPGRLPNLLQRFRDGELDLFTKHGMTNIMYFVPSDIENTLIYIVAHKDQAAAKASWKGFGGDPEWKTLHKASLESGKIVIKVEKQFVTPTDYSPLK
ncbi:MAG: NIPSNAP family protein [Pirellulales bacterium]